MEVNKRQCRRDLPCLIAEQGLAFMNKERGNIYFDGGRYVADDSIILVGSRKVY